MLKVGDIYRLMHPEGHEDRKDRKVIFVGSDTYAIRIDCSRNKCAGIMDISKEVIHDGLYNGEYELIFRNLKAPDNGLAAAVTRVRYKEYIKQGFKVSFECE